MAWTDLAYNQMVSFTDAQSGGFRLLSGQSVDSNQCMTKSEALEKYNLIASNMDFFTDSQLVPKFTWISSCINCTELVGGVIIGSQSWDKCNLNVTTYSDGEPILHVTSSTDWPNTMIGAWCHYDNDPANDAIYGKLYNWYAVAGIWDEASKTDISQRKSLAPVGKSIPTYADWEILINELGGLTVAGARMKEEGTCHWEVDLGNLATNDSGFTALGAGARYGNPAEFLFINQVGAYWSATTELLGPENYYPYLAYLDTSSSVQLTGVFADFGLSVRCLATPTIAPFWELIIEVTNPGDRFGFNIPTGGSPSINIDWGDTNTSNVTSIGFVENTYATPGTYSVKTSGSASSISIALVTGNCGPLVLSTSKISGISGLGSLPELFKGCTNLTSIPSDLFSDLTAVQNFYGTFVGCTSLTSIPENLFTNNVNALLFNYTFWNCTGLTGSIPAGLFDNCPSVNSFQGTFYNCTGLTGSIPAGLFDNCPLVTRFDQTFSNCSDLTGIPTGLFDNNVLVQLFVLTFAYCTSLTSIPSGLFDNCPAVTMFSQTFAGTGLTGSIPAGLFDNNVNVYTFSGAFAQCVSLTSIPSGLFDTNSNVLDFSFLFNGCFSLDSIPVGLFDNNELVTNFSGVFQFCTSLTSIPVGLFDNNVLTDNFQQAFYTCSDLTGIPTGLFDNNELVTNFSATFRDCTSLTSIPTGLFDNNELVINFSYTFNNCASLTSIPAGLFDNNVNVTTFLAIFQSCVNLTTAPSNLFVPLSSSSINFNSVFRDCRSLVQTPDIFGTSYSTTFLNKNVNFGSAFTLDNSYLGATIGVAPELWSFDYDTGSATKTDCWQGHSTSSVSNYASIPVIWL